MQAFQKTACVFNTASYALPNRMWMYYLFPPWCILFSRHI